MNTFEDMSSNRILVLVSGALGVVAFFLPWYLYANGVSMFDVARHALGLNFQDNFPGDFLLAWLGLLAGIALIASAFLPAKKVADILSLIGSVVGLLFVLSIFVTLLATIAGGSTAFKGLNVVSVLGVGFWVAAVGFVVGLIGTLKGRKEEQEIKEKAQWPAEVVSASTSKKYERAEMDANTNNRAFIGGCLGLLGFFLPWVASAFIIGDSLFTYLTGGIASRVSWVELTCAILLLVGGAFALRMRRTAAAIILFSSLLGIAYALQAFFEQSAYTFQYSAGGDKWGGFLLLGVGFWFALIGFIFALTGGLKGLEN